MKEAVADGRRIGHRAGQGDLRRGLETIYRGLRAQKDVTTIRLILGQDDSVGATVQATTLNVGQGFIQRYYSNLLSTVENAGPAR